MARVKVLLIFVLQIVLAWSLSMPLQDFKRQNKLNKTAFQQITTNSKSKLFSFPTKNRIKGNSVFYRLQSQYSQFQQTFYSEAKTVSNSLDDGITDVMNACEKCKGSIVGKDRTQCYASCITQELNTLVPYALLIGDTVQNFFCKPLGFGFETLYSSKSPAWTNFLEFVKLFYTNKDDFSQASLIEIWLSNLLWLNQSPLYLHSFIRSQMALNIANLQNGSNIETGSDDTSTETAARFSEKCGSQWDLRESVYHLISAAKQKSHFLGIVLRGLFTVKSAAFYTLGGYHNIAAGILEAMRTFIGTKCDVISYADGENVSENSCDGLGRSPIPQFPVPLMLMKFLLPCEEELVKTTLVG